MSHRIFQLILIAFLVVVSATGCEKAENSIALEVTSQASQTLSQRSEVNPLIGDSTIFNLARLSTVDNVLLNSYLDYSLDTSDVWDIYDQLQVTRTSWFPEEYPDNATLENAIEYIELNYNGFGIGDYFLEIASLQEELFFKYTTEYSDVPTDQLLAWTEEAFISALQEQDGNIFINTSNTLSARSSACDNCYIGMNECMRSVTASSSATFMTGVGLSVGIITYTGWSGPIAAGSAATAFVGGIIGAGFNQLFGGANCQGALNRCLDRNDCPRSGGGGGDGGRDMRFVNPR